MYEQGGGDEHREKDNDRHIRTNSHNNDYSVAIVPTAVYVFLSIIQFSTDRDKAIISIHFLSDQYRFSISKSIRLNKLILMTILDLIVKIVFQIQWQFKHEVHTPD